jgi:hypothetical protein
MGLLVVCALNTFSHYEDVKVSIDMAKGWQRLTHQSAGSQSVDQPDFRAQQIRLARSGYTPLGAAAMALGLLASAPGLALAISIGAWLVGSELASGTMRYLVLRRPRRYQVLMAKIMSAQLVVLFGGALLFAGFASVNAVASGSLAVGAGPPYAWGLLGMGSPALWIAAALIVVLFGLMLAALGALLGRSAWTGLLGAGGLIFTDFLVSRPLRWYTPWSITYNIWAVGAGFRGALSRVAQPYFWVQDFPNQHAMFARSALYLVGLTALLGAAVVARFRALDL